MTECSVIPSGISGDDRPNMRDLHSYVVVQYAVHWERLGLELGLENYIIKNISENNARHPNRVVVCCVAVFEHWLKEIRGPTWGKLDEVIKKIRSSTTGPVLTVRSGPTGNQVVHLSVSTKINTPSKASVEFSKLVREIVSELEKNEKHSLIYIRDLCTHLSPKDDPTALLFSRERLTAINACNDLKALFLELRDCWRWDNLSLLEEIVGAVGTSDCKSLISQYQQNLDYEMELSMIYKYFEQEKCLPDGYTAMFAVAEKSYFEITLEEYSELKEFASQCCGVKQMFMSPFARSSPDSSVLFEWFIPLTAISYMVKKATSNASAFTQKGFVFLKIDSTEIFDFRFKTIDENQILCDAIECGDAAQVENLLKSVGPDMINKWTALHAAAENGHVAVVETLINLGADPNTISLENWTPLLGAARNNHAAVIETLVKSGADVNGGNLDKWTPVYCAAKCGHVEAVETLIKLGANIRAGDIKKWTPLHSAARNGHAAVVEILLKEGTDINVGDRKNWTPLHAAARLGHVTVVETLIKGGANVNVGDVKKWTPLHAAAKLGHVKVVQTMIDLGADVASNNLESWTPLHGAAEEGHILVVELLINAGAGVNVVTIDEWSPLHFAAEHNHVEVAKCLIKSGANVRAITKDKYAPLHLAAQNGHIQVVETLLNSGSGADINKITIHDWTPLHLAVRNGHSSVAELLINLGVNVNAIDKDGSSALHFAAKINNIKLVELLIKSGAKVNVCDKNLYSPLHFAVKNDHIEMIEILSRAGADVNVVNKFQRTPLHIAIYKDNASLVKRLKSLGADINASIGNRMPLEEAVRCRRKNVVIYFVQEVMIKIDITRLDKPSQIWVKELLEDRQTVQQGNITSCNFI